ncbi:MAG: hypothetical protein HYR94_12975 [Chloroflexi bacterium]|nr:hypothetical protein [Chloroflexota bacterium]
MDAQVQIPTLTEANGHSVAVTYVPTPTDEYRRHRKTMQITVEPSERIPQPMPIPLPIAIGPRVLMWKQDPSVKEIGIRKAYLSGIVLTGPKDVRIISQGLPPVSRNAFGDFIQTPGTDAFDAVHTFAVVRQTLTMYQRCLDGSPLPWAWNKDGNTDPLNVHPHGLPDTMNAFFSRNLKALKFGDFNKPGATPSQRIFTCRSLDIVAHETGHAILDGLKPNWPLSNQPPQTGGLHAPFGDLTAIFLALSQLDQVEAIIAQTKANLHNKTFLADVAEEFGLALGRANGLRNADNNLKLSQVGNEVHAISQVFTGGIYDILADIFAHERDPEKKDDAIVLYEVGQYVCSLVLRALIAAPATKATFADVVNHMLVIVDEDKKPTAYLNSIRNQFHIREVVESPTALTEDMAKGVKLAAKIQDAPKAVQDRSNCCGTMQLDEYNGEEKALQAEVEAFGKWLKDLGEDRDPQHAAKRGR